MPWPEVPIIKETHLCSGAYFMMSYMHLIVAAFVTVTNIKSFGEELAWIALENQNTNDPHTVDVMKGKEVVGHVSHKIP